MLADKIIAQREAGLISAREARRDLRRLARQSRFNAQHSDTPAEFGRWSAEARRAAAARS